ncbi:hypothetical protein ACVWZK_008644 [Bradyrhizobium sp. GM0.4]
MAVATKVEPLIVGKPEPHMIETALSRLGTVRSATLMTGEPDPAGAPSAAHSAIYSRSQRGFERANPGNRKKPAFLALAGHHWVGNWTELRQIVDQLVMLKDTHMVADVLKPLLNSASPTRPTGAFSEREWIMGGLKRNIVERLHVLQDFQGRRFTTK